MIKQITGAVARVEEQAVVVDVNGLGYLVHTPHAVARFSLTDAVCLYTHLAVRENSLDLYGFLDLETLNIFELLIDLPKIGPKSALQILTQADTPLLKEAVRNNDAGYLSKLSGIGKKSAEKIVAGLQDKLLNVDTPDNLTSNDRVVDAVDALVALGYSEIDARQTIKLMQISEDISNMETADFLKKAMKLLGSGPR